MIKKLLPILIFLVGVLRCTAAIPYVIQVNAPASGDSTALLQSVINSYASNTINYPQGGSIRLGPGVFYISSPLTFNATSPTNYSISIEGSGSLSCAVVQTTSNNVIQVTGSSPNGANLRLRNVTIAETTNACVALVNLASGVSTFTCDDVNYVWWTAWTNNALGGPNFYKTGCTQTNNLVGVIGNVVANSPSDLSVVNNCGSFGLASAIDVSGFDHIAIQFCRWYFSPSAFIPGGSGSPTVVTNNWPVGSPYRTGAAITSTSIADGNTDRTSFHNHYFGCAFAFLVAGAEGYPYRPQVSIHDQFEDEIGIVEVTPDCVFNLENPQLQPIGAGVAPFSKIIHAQQVAGDPASYTVEDSGEATRTGNLQTYWQRLNFNGISSIGGLSVLPLIQTNVSGILLTNGDLAGGNVIFTNPVAGHTAGTTLYTNAAFGGGVLFDPTFASGQADRFGIYKSGTYEGGFDPFAAWPVTPNYLSAPGNFDFPWKTANTFAMQFNGQQWFGVADWNGTYAPDVKLFFTNSVPAWQVSVQSNASFSVPATYLSQGYLTQISNGVQPGIAFMGSNTANYVAAQIACLADHNGVGQSELFFGSQAQICMNPTALNPNLFGSFQMGVESYPMESFMAADGYFSAAGYNDLWTSNTTGHSFGHRFQAWWNNTNAGGTLIASGRASPGIVGMATSNTNMAPGAPASIGTGGGALEFYTVLPYSTGVFTYSNVPNTRIMRIDTNFASIWGGLQVNVDDRNGNSSTVAFNLRDGDAGMYFAANGFNSGFVNIGGAGGGSDAMTFSVKDNSGSFLNVFQVNGGDGAGVAAGKGSFFNQALTVGTNSKSTYGFPLEVYGGPILASNSSGYFIVSGNGITNSGTFTNSGAVNLGSTLTVQGGNVITGNGAGLTNLSTAFSNSFTNWVIGQINTNSTGRPWFVQTDALLTPAAVSGAVDMVLEVSDGNGHGRTNTTGFATTALSIVMSYTNGLSGIVPTGYGFTFTNRSSGAGNSAALVPKSGTLLDY